MASPGKNGGSSYTPTGAEEESRQRPSSSRRSSSSTPFGQVPDWVYFWALMLGVPLSGLGGSFFGANQGTADIVRMESNLVRLEDKVDTLADKNEELAKVLLDLRISVIRFHARDLNALPQSDPTRFQP